jgi:hypothetical protein
VVATRKASALRKAEGEAGKLGKTNEPTGWKCFLACTPVLMTGVKNKSIDKF